MSSSLSLSITTFVFCLAALFYIAAVIFKRPMLGHLATSAAIAAWAGNTVGFVQRWIESYQMGIGHVPLSNMYESLVFFAWTIISVSLFVEFRYKNKLVGAFAAPLAFLAIAYASLAPGISDRIQPLIPALKSNWLIAHVVTCFFGYAGFAIAFGLSLLYLFKQPGDHPDRLRSYLPSAAFLDELTHQMTLFGFLFLTIGIITGAVWANSAWGSYWSWDPKETWSLITWLIYAVLLHARLMRGWRGRRIAWLSIIGFMAVLFTYFGVNLLPGLHSYGQG